MTVAALKQKGATALNEEQLKALLVGKAVWMRNTVTAEQIKVSYTTEGQSIVSQVGKNGTLPSNAGNVAQTGSQGLTMPYTIKDGKVVMTISQEP